MKDIKTASKMAKPFLKWVGGKGQFIEQLDAQSQHDRIPGYLGTTIQSLF